jgi:hypothetical protein
MVRKSIKLKNINTNTSTNSLKIIFKLGFIFLIILLLGMGWFYINKCNNRYRENMANFAAPDDIANSLGQIFKRGDLNLNAYPNIEIKPGRKLFDDNKFLPECCMYNSYYSTDKGCPCITPEQQYYLQRRGLNRSKNSMSNVVKKDDTQQNYKNVFFSPTMAIKGEKMPFLKHNTYFKNAPPDLEDSKESEFYKLTNLNSFDVDTDNIY